MVGMWVQSSGLHVQGPRWSGSMAEVSEVSEMARVCRRGLVGFRICNIHHIYMGLQSLIHSSLWA
jgi:hypothetical protein